jgi:integrase
MAVIKRGKKWAYRFKHQGETQFKGGFDCAVDAENAENEYRLRLSDTMTFAVMAERRLQYVQTYCTNQYLIDTRAILARFNGWNHIPLSLISRDMVTQRILALAQELSPNNVNRHIRGLKALFEMAVNDDFIPKNPVIGIKFLPVSRAPRVVPMATTIKEVLLRATPEEQAFLTVLWQTAARYNEIAHLTWDDVDLRTGTVRLWTRKSKGSNRISRNVTMLPDVRKALKFAWKNRVIDSPWVFTSEAKMTKYPDNPELWHYGYRSKMMGRLTSKFTFHALRHSTASTLAAIGVDLPVIQKILGHARPTTTDLYLSAMPKGVSDGMAKLGDYLKGVSDYDDDRRNRDTGGSDPGGGQ